MIPAMIPGESCAELVGSATVLGAFLGASVGIVLTSAAWALSALLRHRRERAARAERDAELSRELEFYEEIRRS
jgi:hypothetical protein